MQAADHAMTAIVLSAMYDAKVNDALQSHEDTVHMHNNCVLSRLPTLPL